MSSATTTLTPHQRFIENGFYIHAESVLAPDLLRRAAQGLADVRNGVYDTGRPPLARNWDPGDDPTVLAKLDNPHLASSALLAALVDSDLGRVAGEVTGADWVQAWVIQGLYKPPTPGTTTNNSNVGWHQDQTYWHEIFEPESELLTAWLALSDVTAESGPMRFVPRSHTWGQLDGSFWEQDQEANKAQIHLPEGEVWTEFADVLPPGGVSFHHRWLLHGSNQNVSALPRMSMAIHLRTDKSRPLAGGHVLTEHIDDTETYPVIFRR